MVAITDTKTIVEFEKLGLPLSDYYLVNISPKDSPDTPYYNYIHVSDRELRPDCSYS
jgi:hypothetical protein